MKLKKKNFSGTKTTKIQLRNLGVTCKLAPVVEVLVTSAGFHFPKIMQKFQYGLNRIWLKVTVTLLYT